MEVVTLGTGSPIPDPNRAGPATLVRAGGRQFLFDCGRGVLLRLAGAGALPITLSALLLTHLHSDHTTDLNDVLTTRWVMSPVPLPLEVFGPVGTEAFVDATVTAMATDIGYRLGHHADLTEPPGVAVTEVASGVVVSSDEVVITCAPTDHAPVHPTVGYRIAADGAVVVVAGDTIPCAGLDTLVEGADVYVQTVVRPSLIEQIPSARLHDVLDYHSSVVQAAETARRGGVQTLVLTHLVPAPFPGTEGDWIAEAAAHFDGEVIVAVDGWSRTVGST